MELEFVRWLRERACPTPGIEVGIGDDAAVLTLSREQSTVVSTDMLMDGVDFRLAEVSPRRVGRKALAVNLSDLAAMAAIPHAALVSLAVPRKLELEWLQEFYVGLEALAAEFDTTLVGGDTNSWDGPLVINVTVLGSTTSRGPLLRRGARPGDAILVTGTLGGSILGHHLEFTPRVREALELHRHYELHAGMDISDGLTLDLSRLCEESGCGAELELARIPVSAAATQWAEQRRDGLSPLEHALQDGEDFELLLAVPAAEAERLLVEQPLAVPLTRIGAILAEPGLFARAADGTRHPLQPRGYVH